MKIVYGFDNFKGDLPYPVITMGNFDGVHLGHREIFQQLTDTATKKNGTSFCCLHFIPYIFSQGNIPEFEGTDLNDEQVKFPSDLSGKSDAGFIFSLIVSGKITTLRH